MNNNHWVHINNVDGPNHHGDQGPQNVDRELGIKIVIPKYDDKMQP